MNVTNLRPDQPSLAKQTPHMVAAMVRPLPSVYCKQPTRCSGILYIGLPVLSAIGGSLKEIIGKYQMVF